MAAAGGVHKEFFALQEASLASQAAALCGAWPPSPPGAGAGTSGRGGGPGDDAVLSAASTPVPVPHRGWLSKRGGMFGGYSRSFFVLASGTLFSFRDDSLAGGGCALGAAILTSGRAVSAAEPRTPAADAAGGATASSAPDVCFEIWTVRARARGWAGGRAGGRVVHLAVIQLDSQAGSQAARQPGCFCEGFSLV